MYWQDGRAAAVDALELLLACDGARERSVWLPKVRASFWEELCRPGAEAVLDCCQPTGPTVKVHVFWGALGRDTQGRILVKLREARRDRSAEVRRRAGFNETAQQCFVECLEREFFRPLAVM